jgi:hypothetical protein
MICSNIYTQDNYEIQVYGSETVLPKTTIVELHSNYTGGGTRTIDNGIAKIILGYRFK